MNHQSSVNVWREELLRGESMLRRRKKNLQLVRLQPFAVRSSVYRQNIQSTVDRERERVKRMAVLICCCFFTDRWYTWIWKSQVEWRYITAAVVRFRARGGTGTASGGLDIAAALMNANASERCRRLVRFSFCLGVCLAESVVHWMVERARESRREEYCTCGFLWTQPLCVVQLCWWQTDDAR